MDELTKLLFENKSPEEINHILVNLNRRQLNKKSHIKKYNKLRDLHSEIVNHMVGFGTSGSYNISDYLDIIKNELKMNHEERNIVLDGGNPDDDAVLTELFLYKNHDSIPAITDIYLENGKFRNEDKVKMLKAMQNSYVGLFKIIDVDKSEGYVTYLDVFTHKKFKIIDIAMSSTLKVDDNMPVYIYNRIITIDNISFGTNIHCIFLSKNKELEEFIKRHNYKKCSNLLRCLVLYDISKRDKKIHINYNHTYGNRYSAKKSKLI